MTCAFNLDHYGLFRHFSIFVFPVVISRNGIERILFGVIVEIIPHVFSQRCKQVKSLGVLGAVKFVTAEIYELSFQISLRYNG